MGSSGGQNPVTQQTQQTKDPWAPAQPHLQQAMNSAGNLFNTDSATSPTTGATQATRSNLSTRLEQCLQHALALCRKIRRHARRQCRAAQLGTNMIQNQGSEPELQSLYEQAQGDQNPYLQNMLDTSNRQISDKIGSSM